MRHWRYIGEIIDWNIEKKKKKSKLRNILYFFIYYIENYCVQ